jgi:hypothetical protein
MGSASVTCAARYGIGNLQGVSFGNHVNRAMPFSELNDLDFDAAQACTDRAR